jgi:hypothetical protein
MLRTARWMSGAVRSHQGFPGRLICPDGLFNRPTRTGRALREKSNLLRQISLFLPVQSRLQKNFCFPETQITSISLAIPSHSEGRFAVVTDVGRDAVDADGAKDEST